MGFHKEIKLELAYQHNKNKKPKKLCLGVNKQISYLSFKFFTHLHTFCLLKRYAIEVPIVD
jgi:hypothetical protein